VSLCRAFINGGVLHREVGDYQQDVAMAGRIKNENLFLDAALRKVLLKAAKPAIHTKYRGCLFTGAFSLNPMRKLLRYFALNQL
jgi:hypothetical protein